MTDTVGFFRRSFVRLVTIAAISTMGFATTANAEESEAAVTTATAAKGGAMLGEADAAFAEIFKNWSGQSKGNSVTLKIPSRKPVTDYALTSSYGFRSDPFAGGRRRHKGIDMAGPIGTPIYATADGIVGRAEWVGGYGKYVEINHGNEIQTRYGHMSRLNVNSMQRVKAGDLIGYMGSTGRSTGSHLHYEVRIAGEAVNPIPFMQSHEFLAAEARKGSVGLGGPKE